MSAERPGDLWLRLRFQRHRLPRDYPPNIDADMLLRQAVKVIGRRFGYAVEEIRDVKAQAVQDGAGDAPPPAGAQEVAKAAVPL